MLTESQNSRVQHHLAELGIARDPTDPRHALPTLLDSDKAILDIGCGIGQTFLALGCSGRTCVGVDVDETVLRYGKSHNGDKIHFVCASAARIPLPSGTFDLVICRVSLPYMSIPKALSEIRRVLKLRGRLWMTLHSRDRVLDQLRAAIGRRSARSIASRFYVLANGYVFKYSGLLVPLGSGRYESWQDPCAICALLKKRGFSTRLTTTAQQLIVEGYLG